MPSTGALSRTTVSEGAGAQTRWAPIFSGLILGLMLLTVAPLAEFIKEIDKEFEEFAPVLKLSVPTKPLVAWFDVAVATV